MKDAYMHIEIPVQLNVADVAFDIGHRMPQKVALETILQIDEATSDMEFTYKAINALIDVAVCEAQDDPRTGDKALAKLIEDISAKLDLLRAALNPSPQSELF